MAPPAWSKARDQALAIHTMTDSLPDPADTPERILILDFGSQVTQLIARRLREFGIYCEIWPFNADADRIAQLAPARDHPFRRPGIGS